MRLPLAAPEIKVTALSREPFLCFLPKRHPLTRHKKIAPELLSAEPFILYERRQAPAFFDRIMEICSRSGFSPLGVQEASEMQTILSMVASELGISILPKSASELGIKGVAMRSLAGNWPQSELGLATLSSTSDQPLLRKFVKTSIQLERISAD